MKICVVGGGNIGTLLAGEFAQRPELTVSLLVGDAGKFCGTITVNDIPAGTSCTASPDCITSDPREAVQDADIIFLTVPAFVMGQKVHEITPFVKKGAMLGVAPGSGGREYFFSELIKSGCTFFGLQRVHAIARLREYGRSVDMTGRKPSISVAALPAGETERVRAQMEALFRVPCYALPNYLTITLTPSNQILHTTRLFSLFAGYMDGMYWQRNPGFYEEWSPLASDMLFRCDSELQELCKRLNQFDLRGVKSLREHYESPTEEALTRKIRSIPAFKGILSPMVQTEHGFIPDKKSRYFTEDFPYGLCIIKGICHMADLQTPYIDTVLKWYQDFSGKEYITSEGFCGKDLGSTGIPQIYGIHTMDDLVSFYL